MTEQNLVTLKIDGKEVSVPAGTLVIRAAEELGIHIPRFCDHPLLKPVAACRQCLVEIAMPDREGVVRPMPKPQPSCAMTVMENMEVKTQLSSETAKKAQEGITEFILLNHPLDCPICDKAGQCPLQDHAYQVGRTQSRFCDEKRVKEKPVSLSEQILLDRQRCILCQKCVRFAKEIAGDPFIDLQLRGTREEIGRFAPDSDGNFYFGDASNSCGSDLDLDLLTSKGQSFASYFSGNIIDICPVGALTSKSYRFKARPFDLVTHQAVSEFDSSGTVLNVDIRNNKILRRNVSGDYETTEGWLNDKERFGYTWQNDKNRITKPIVDGKESSWGNAYMKLLPLLETKIGFLPGGCLTVEDAYAWSKFARVVGQTNAIDFRYRHTNVNEEIFAYNRSMEYLGSKENFAEYVDLENAKNIVLIDFEPEEECTSVFLKLYKSVRNNSAKVYALNPFQSPGSKKLSAKLLEYEVGKQADKLNELFNSQSYSELIQDLTENSAVVIAGEKAVDYLPTVVEFAEKIKAKLAFIPRRISEGAGFRYGITPNLLPNAISIKDNESLAELSQIWDSSIPTDEYKDYDDILDKVINGQIETLFVGGVDIDDYPNREKFIKALEKANVVSLEVRESEVTSFADIVLPVAPPSEKNGTYVNWVGDKLPFGQLFTTVFMSDREVLSTIAELKNVDLNLQTLAKVHAELEKVESIPKHVKQLDYYESVLPEVSSDNLADNVLSLATSKTLLDDGMKIKSNIHLQNSSRMSVARLSQNTANKLGIKTGDKIKIVTYFDTLNDTHSENLETDLQSIVLPVQITQMSDKMIWIPQNACNSKVYKTLKIDNGQKVLIEKLDLCCANGYREGIGGKQ